MTTSKILSSLSRWPLFLAYTLFLYTAYTLPGGKIPEVVMRANDKVLHGISFFLLASLAFRTFRFSSLSSFQTKAEGKAIGFSLFYGAYLEWVQRTIPGRDASFADWFADAVGILAASGIFWISKLTQPS